ncbi:hypothetical protein CJO94_21240 (plasmid) [Ralstonia solanacearum]|nr:hypothetical protein CJO94_21240 [Ralstonia solanacearum]
MALLRRLADKGRAPFQVQFGEEVMRGDRVNSDMKLARGYFLSAAEQGYKPAIFKYIESFVGNVGTLEDGLSAMVWVRVARICLGDDYSGKMDSIERSIMASDFSASIKLRESDINRDAGAMYNLIATHAKNTKGLDFRYCGVEH